MIVSKPGVVELERAKRGWEVPQLAREAGVCKSVVYNAENGASVKAASAAKIAAALGTPFEDLFEVKRH